MESFNNLNRLHWREGQKCYVLALWIDWDKWSRSIFEDKLILIKERRYSKSMHWLVFKTKKEAENKLKEIINEEF